MSATMLEGNVDGVFKVVLYALSLAIYIYMVLICKTFYTLAVPIHVSLLVSTISSICFPFWGRL